MKGEKQPLVTPELRG